MTRRIYPPDATITAGPTIARRPIWPARSASDAKDLLLRVLTCVDNGKPLPGELRAAIENYIL